MLEESMLRMMSCVGAIARKRFWVYVAQLRREDVFQNFQVRYDVPRVVFVNKMDRYGADPVYVMQQIREKLGLCVARVQVLSDRRFFFAHRTLSLS